ncbi:3-deoxy-D-manno-octulosonic acid transferase [Paracoccus jiaweipingae]|uniref:3-deoxy-D-manno-octulosonic acid transferase n=1 Tax=unclassified Paracoccus (in: a-proteobacteria) TaxID=2688777 RepID=UPI0037B69191
MLYRLATRLAQPLAALALRAGLAQPALAQRLAQVQQPALDRPVWLHAASVGELASATRIIAALRQHHPLLITTNSTTGTALARDLAAHPAPFAMAVQLAPLDFPQALETFLAHHRPRLYIAVESEIWPNRSAALAARGVAQAMIGGRLSARSARRWGRMRGLVGPVLARLAAFSAQDADSEARLLALGAPASARLPQVQLKLLDPARTPLPADSPARDMTVLAASTHDGEDAAILDAFLSVHARHPQARLILAPRHPRRGDAIAALIAARGQSVRRRSSGDSGAGATVLLADTLGEMADWYRAAGICIVAGSFGRSGGHTPWEPAAHCCAILHGPDVANHADGYALLDAAGGARAVNTGTLAPALDTLLADAAQARAMGHAARAVLDDHAGDARPLLTQLLALAG